MENYMQLIQNCLSIIQMRRSEKMEELFTFGEFGLKPMFLEKYTPLKQILDSGVAEEVNIGIYKNGALVLEAVDKEAFKSLYEQVALKVLEIEEKYQAYLVELNNQPTEERLHFIIEHQVF